MLEHVPLDDTRRAGDDLAEAFMADPMFRFLLPRVAARRTWLRALMRSNLRMLWPSGHVYRAGSDGGAVLGLAPPGAFPPAGGRVLRMVSQTTLASLRTRMSPRSVLAGLWLVRTMERLHPVEPHWYVHVVGVHPDGQGRGLGGELLTHVATLADHDGLPAYLETSNPRNLSFYRRFGFEVTLELEGPWGTPPMWTMSRPPASGAAAAR